MEAIFSSIAVFLLSSVKFLSGLVVAVVSPGMNLLPSYITTVGGGIAGVFAFVFFGELIKAGYNRLFPNRTVKKFTKMNRFLVRLRRTFGVPGIAFLTPVLSIPIGIFLSLSVSKNKARIIGFMTLSFAVWSSVFFLPKHFFDLNLLSLISGIF